MELVRGFAPVSLATIYTRVNPIPTTEKEVDYVENKPFQFKVNVANGGRQVDIEVRGPSHGKREPWRRPNFSFVVSSAFARQVRLKVLSSQHEDMFFIVKFMALDPLTKREVSPYLVAHSFPIKVISVHSHALSHG